MARRRHFQPQPRTLNIRNVLLAQVPAMLPPIQVSSLVEFLASTLAALYHLQHTPNSARHIPLCTTKTCKACSDGQSDFALVAPLQLPENLELLTLRLTPATYRTGASVQDGLRQHLTQTNDRSAFTAQHSDRVSASSSIDAAVLTGNSSQAERASSFDAINTEPGIAWAPSVQQPLLGTVTSCPAHHDLPEAVSRSHPHPCQLALPSIFTELVPDSGARPSDSNPSAALKHPQQSRRSQIYGPMVAALKESPLMLAAVGSVFLPLSTVNCRNQPVELPSKPGSPPVMLHPKFAGLVLRESCKMLLNDNSSASLNRSPSRLYPTPANSQQEEAAGPPLAPATPTPQPPPAAASLGGSPQLGSPSSTSVWDSQCLPSHVGLCATLERPGTKSTHMSLAQLQGAGDACSKQDTLFTAPGWSVVATMTISSCR